MLLDRPCVSAERNRDQLGTTIHGALPATGGESVEQQQKSLVMAFSNMSQNSLVLSSSTSSTQIYEGTNQVQRVVVAKHLLK
jgi:alkylation response protein AidB-like acyl-CoA dehydrogenase